MMGTPNLISDNMDCGLSYSVISYLKKLSQQVSISALFTDIQNNVFILNRLDAICRDDKYCAVHFDNVSEPYCC